ncbi:hypothetical protein THAOC_18382, partial [Thalassiosira oceanica]
IATDTDRADLEDGHASCEGRWSRSFGRIPTDYIDERDISDSITPSRTSFVDLYVHLHVAFSFYFAQSSCQLHPTMLEYAAMTSSRDRMNVAFLSAEKSYFTPSWEQPPHGPAEKNVARKRSRKPEGVDWPPLARIDSFLLGLPSLREGDRDGEKDRPRVNVVGSHPESLMSVEPQVTIKLPEIQLTCPCESPVFAVNLTRGGGGHSASTRLQCYPTIDGTPHDA